MASITLKNVPDDLLKRLRRRAERNRRSLMKEVLFLLEIGVERGAELGLEPGGRSPESGWGLAARESTPVYGGESGVGLSPERERERQVEVWRDLCGQWESSESVAEELEALSAARTGGREVDL